MGDGNPRKITQLAAYTLRYPSLRHELLHQTIIALGITDGLNCQYGFIGIATFCRKPELAGTLVDDEINNLHAVHIVSVWVSVLGLDLSQYLVGNVPTVFPD